MVDAPPEAESPVADAVQIGGKIGGVLGGLGGLIGGAANSAQVLAEPGGLESFCAPQDLPETILSIALLTLPALLAVLLAGIAATWGVIFGALFGLVRRG